MSAAERLIVRQITEARDQVADLLAQGDTAAAIAFQASITAMAGQLVELAGAVGDPVLERRVGALETWATAHMAATSQGAP